MSSELDYMSLREKITIPQIDIPERDMSRYNGGFTGIDFGIIDMHLPYPEEGMMWAMRWRDTPSGELLPDVVQVPVGEPVSGWHEGFPKYDK